MDVDDVVMHDDTPSTNTQDLYLFHPPSSITTNDNKQYDAVHGKWMIYAEKGVILDNMWTTLKSHFAAKEKECFVFIKISTAKPNSHVSNNKIGIIMVYCQRRLPTAAILDVGKWLIQLLNYTSPYGKMYYKSEGHHRTHNTVATRNFTFALPVPLPPLSTAAVSTATTTTTTSSHFDVPFSAKDWAKQLGVTWDAKVKKWCAPNEQVRIKMCSYFKATDDTTAVQKIATTYQQQVAVFSMNVWTSAEHRTERMHDIVQEITQRLPRLPDFVCLQELVQETFDVLDPLLHKAGYDTHSQFRPYRHFCEMLYFKKTTVVPTDFQQLAFTQSTAHREIHLLHYYHCPSNTSGICATAHFEAGLEKQAMRMHQLQHTLKTLDTFKKPWLFAGDTNLAYYQEEELKLQEHVKDAWEMTGRDPLKQATWNPRLNSNILRHPHIGICRFDRVLFDARGFVATDFQLTCTTAIPVIMMHPSDHFGILAAFVVVHTGL